MRTFLHKGVLVKLPKAFTDDSDLGMCFEKKVIMNEQYFYQGNIEDQAKMLAKLLFCMKESNEKNAHDFPFYQLRVRPVRMQEAPFGICFEFRWGNRDLLEKKNETK